MAAGILRFLKPLLRTAPLEVSGDDGDPHDLYVGLSTFVDALGNDTPISSGLPVSQGGILPGDAVVLPLSAATASVKAFKLFDSAGVDSDLTFTSTVWGVKGNLTRIRILNDVAADPPTIDVSAAPDFTIHAKIGTSTAAQVKTAWDAAPIAASYATVALEAVGAGVVDAFVMTALATGAGNIVIPVLAGKKPRVMGYLFVCADAVDVQWLYTAGGNNQTSLSGKMSIDKKSGAAFTIELPFAVFAPDTLDGSVDLFLSAGIQTSGHVSFYRV